MEFSTTDTDNDKCSCNCADGGWGANWWNSCGSNNINGKYGGDGDAGGEFIFWYWFDNNRKALKSMTLMFREVD